MKLSNCILPWLFCGIPLVASAAPTLEIEQVLANGKSVAFSRESGVMLPAGRHDLEIRFRTVGETPGGWIVEYQLEGQDSAWHSVDGAMAMTVRVLGADGSELSVERQPVQGQNVGWPPVQKRSNLNRRIKPLVVPEGAHSVEITFDSGTWRPELTGEWVVGEVTINRSSQQFGPKESFWPNPDFLPAVDDAEFPVPKFWERRGDPEIARLEKSPPPPVEEANLLTLRDFSTTSAGAWVARTAIPADVRAGEVLTVGWWERNRVGDQRSHSARYSDLKPGAMTFRAVGRGLGAVYLDGGITLPVFIEPYIWTQTWFAPLAVLVGGSFLGLLVWQTMRRGFRRKLARLEFEARVEKDRMRIASDIHDDVGAQLTRLGLMCAGFSRGASPAQVEQLATASRRIVQSMDEIVWAVDPGNDSLDQLGTFLCRFMDEFLEDSGIRARYSVPATLPGVRLNSEVRHNILLAVKEALNNSVKYASAREIRLSLATTDSTLEITVADDGIGFDVGNARSGNGLRNMRARLENIGGTFRLESAIGSGTRVAMHWPLPEER